MTLLGIPIYFVDRCGVYNVEICAKQFEAAGKPYLNHLKKRLRWNGCEIINLQTKGEFDFSDISEENGLKGDAKTR